MTMSISLPGADRVQARNMVRGAERGGYRSVGFNPANRRRPNVQAGRTAKPEKTRESRRQNPIRYRPEARSIAETASSKSPASNAPATRAPWSSAGSEDRLRPITAASRQIQGRSRANRLVLRQNLARRTRENFLQGRAQKGCRFKKTADDREEKTKIREHDGGAGRGGRAPGAVARSRRLPPGVARSMDGTPNASHRTHRHLS